MEQITTLQSMLLAPDSFSSEEKISNWKNTLNQLISAGEPGLSILLDERILAFKDEPAFLETIFIYSNLLEGDDKGNLSAYFYYVIYKIYQKGCKYITANFQKAKSTIPKLKAVNNLGFKYIYAMDVIKSDNDNTTKADALDELINIYYTGAYPIKTEDLIKMAETIYKIKDSILVSKYLPFLETTFVSYASVNRLNEIVPITGIFGILGKDTGNPRAIDSYNFARMNGDYRATTEASKIEIATANSSVTDMSQAVRHVSSYYKAAGPIVLAIFGFSTFGFGIDFFHIIPILIGLAMIVPAFILTFSQAKKIPFANEPLYVDAYVKMAGYIRIPMLVGFNLFAFIGSFTRVIVALSGDRADDAMMYMWFGGLILGFFVEIAIIVVACLIGVMARGAARSAMAKQH